MFLELFYLLVLVARMLHCLGLPQPGMDLPSWVLAFPLGDPSLLHLGPAILGRQVERLEVEPWYCIFLMLWAWWPFPWFWPSLGLRPLSLVPPLCFLHSGVLGKKTSFVDDSPTLTGIMPFVLYVNQKKSFAGCCLGWAMISPKYAREFLLP